METYSRKYTGGVLSSPVSGTPRDIPVGCGSLLGLFFLLFFTPFQKEEAIRLRADGLLMTPLVLLLDRRTR